MDLYTETGVQHIETITRHLPHGTMCGDSSLISAEVYQVFLGTEMFFLECDSRQYAHRDKSQWMDYLWEFCSKSDLTIKISNMGNQKKTFRRDAAITDVLHESRTTVVPVSVARQINRCRL